MVKKKSIREKKSHIEQGFRVLKQKFHPSFGDIKLWINSKNRKIIFSKEIIENDHEKA